MSQLWDRIRAAISEQQFIVSAHAAIRLRQLRIPSWQAAAASVDGRLLREHPKAEPNPTAEVEILLPDGQVAHAVWAWLADDRTAKLVTVFFPNL